jgi:hypothetical protein
LAWLIDSDVECWPRFRRPHCVTHAYRGASPATINRAYASPRLCSSYFTFTQIPLMMGTTLLYPGITAGIPTPGAKRLFAVVHWASSANDTVVTECETPTPGLAFITALKMINNHIPSPHDTVCSLPSRSMICYPYRVGAAPALGG